MWDLNNFFDSAVDWNNSFLKSINNLQFCFNLISYISLQNEVVFFDHFVPVDDNLSDFCGKLFNGDNLFFNDWNLNNFLLDDWDLHNLFSDSFNNLIDLHDNWVVDKQLNNLRYLNDLLIVSLNFINSWNLVSNSDNLFNNVWNFNDLLDG